MRWLTALLVVNLLLTGCRGTGAPLWNNVSSIAPTLPSTATFDGNLIPPPATGSFVPSLPATPSLTSGINSAGRTGGLATGFQYTPITPAINSTAGTNFNSAPANFNPAPVNSVASASNPVANAINSVANASNDPQSPFWQRYQPLNFNQATVTAPATAPGFTPSISVPPAAYPTGNSAPVANNPFGGGVNGTVANNSSTPSNWGNWFGTPTLPTSFQGSGGSTVPYAPTAGTTNTVNNQPSTYAGNNPILAWANRLNNFIFSAPSTEPGPWQSWSTNGPVAPQQPTTYGTPVNSPAGFGPGVNSPNANSFSQWPDAGATTWQTKPSPVSLRTQSNEPPVKIPDEALAAARNTNPRTERPVPNFPPLTYPTARTQSSPPVAPTQPVTPTQPTLPTQPVAPSYSTPSAIPPSRTVVGNDAAWPELSRLPK